MPSDTRRSHVRRSNVTACARCKARKQRCDQNIPACSNCERAGVECVGHDVDGSVVPRSYIKNLEDHVALLEQEIQRYRSTDQSIPSETKPGPEFVEQVLAQASFVSLHTSSYPSPRYMGTGCGLPLLRLLLVGLGASAPIDRVSTCDPGLLSIADLLPHEVVVQLPANNVSLRLIDVYLEHSDFFSPIFYRADILGMLDAAGDIPCLKVRFKIFMIMAIALQVLNRTDSSISITRSDAFFSAASRILLTDSANLLTGDLEHMEILLLMIQYSSFSSSPAGTWHIIGLATRLAVDLGLHDEPPHRLRLDPLALDRRRRIFWATYTFERNLCAVLGRPVSIPDEAIFVSLPANSGPSRVALAVHLIKFRRFESEIMQILHQQPPLASRNFEHYSWRDDMRQRLYEWRTTVPFHENPTQLAPMEIFDGYLYNSLVHLFSPSRHISILSADDLVFLADCAKRSIEAYRSSFRDGKLRFYWRTIHNLFRSGVSLIYCLKNWPQGRDLDTRSAHTTINLCSSVLWGMVERYPEGKPGRDTFETLYQSFQQSNTEHLSHLQTQSFPFADSLGFAPATLDTSKVSSGPIPDDSVLEDVSLPHLYAWDL
ncbi:hypothetical protein P153DRAFT_340820 [Dothidotthia symphoricarpi CBS 119687]|uniref:Zn(2)-C6 fungal-type domain-containing protein n=1 Tax=Dothidotthia symphoricarpi CBS 119687 TaxID=1392245 RepID=A0A6A6ACR3_9PLEO|nr:uncharacterized protein P153DRAFT_340820 [Dothidotthia symphoricarpi CBS 119687]KAF2129692.1 hypothetical protein P153DRAFT_340820 [Dothidotthia symphoricarpi CBS 119687]